MAFRGKKDEIYKIMKISGLPKHLLYPSKYLKSKNLYKIFNSF